jgi:hypothetical protein
MHQINNMHSTKDNSLTHAWCDSKGLWQLVPSGTSGLIFRHWLEFPKFLGEQCLGSLPYDILRFCSFLEISFALPFSIWADSSESRGSTLKPSCGSANIPFESTAFLQYFKQVAFSEFPTIIKYWQIGSH